MFWYPGRVIDCPGDKELETKSHTSYTIKLWRECEFDEKARKLTPNMLVEVKIKDIVDCLWNGNKRRRKIRVSETLFL